MKKIFNALQDKVNENYDFQISIIDEQLNDDFPLFLDASWYFIDRIYDSKNLFNLMKKEIETKQLFCFENIKIYKKVKNSK